ncbi:type IV secretory system conjugative DNA transfer family protein [Campylobacter lanienae]|uniref:type IV secretory system conjugative DNA transfer family protein n=1 Tax=Campylobacter lanienae TaxID=75658 RepID=UPI000BB438D0|nr:TraM recognition domain-containing protein [Campylobacter lanienae]
MRVVDAEVKHLRPNTLNVKEFLINSPISLLLVNSLGGLSIIFCIIAMFYYNINFEVMAYSTSCLLFFIAYEIWISPINKDNKESIIPNEKDKEYFLNLGYEVKKFYGDAIKSSRAQNNKTRPLLINAETMKRHFLCMATVGAGKSVFMKGLIEQYAVLGGGCLIIDGKGTSEFAREIYGVCASVGREDDFVYLNFLDMDNTHTINPLLTGNPLSLYELLIALLAGEENEWKAKQKEFMKNILKLLCYRRDTEEDFVLNFSVLTDMMNLTTLTNNAIKYKHLAKKVSGIEDFVKFVSSSIGVDYEEFLNGDVNNKKWLDEMKKASQNTDLQGVYDASMSAGAWRGVITNLSSDYGRIFNVPNADMSLWEATQRNKIIFVTLPTMDSDTTPKEIGGLILGLIKNVAAKKAKDAEQPRLPFACFCDELGSYVIEGFGRLESKSRSLGIGVMPFFQSPAQIDVVAKNDYERKEIIDVTGVHILMKNMHPETTEFYAKLVEKKTIINRNYVERREMVEGKGAVEDTYNTEEKEAIEHNEVVNMSNGEMMVFENGKVHRAIACTETSLLEGKTTTYKPKDLENPKIPIVQYVSKIEFFDIVENCLKDEELKKLVNEKNEILEIAS